MFGNTSPYGTAWIDLPMKAYWEAAEQAYKHFAGDDLVKLGHSRGLLDKKEEEPVELTESQRDAIRRRMFEKSRAENRKI